MLWFENTMFPHFRFSMDIPAKEPVFKLFQAPKKFAAPKAAAVSPGQPPEFTRLFQDKTVQPGDEVSFDCTIIGEPKPKVRII